MPGGQQVRADLASHDQQLIKLEVVVAQAARDGRASGEVVLHEGSHDLALEALLVVDDVVRNADELGNGPGVVHVVERATTALHGLGHALLTGEAALVPELHGQTDHVVTIGTQHGRDGGGIDTARHGNGNGLRGHRVAQISTFRRDVELRVDGDASPRRRQLPQPGDGLSDEGNREVHFLHCILMAQT